MPTLVRAAAVQDIPPGHSKLLHIQGREIALFNAEGTFYAVKNSCPHRGVGLNRGAVENGILTCPGHAWQFDLSTGESITDDMKVARYETKVEGADVFVALG